MLAMGKRGRICKGIHDVEAQNSSREGEEEEK